MARFLPIVVLLILVLIVGGYFYLKRVEVTPSTQTQELKTLTGNNGSNILTPVTTEDRVKILEDAVVILAKKVNGGTTSDNTTLEAKVASLESQVASLQKQVNQLQGKTTQTTTTQTSTSSKPSPVYIPLGWVASSTAMDWTTISSQSVTIDTNNYPGMTSAQFEARIMNYQGNGTAFARLINTTDGTAILGSQVSASGTDYSWVTSSGFSLASGQKTYAVQLKTNTGYAAQIADAHIKINY